MTPEERQEQRLWAYTVFRLGMSGNRAGLHAELLRQENEVINLLAPHDQDYYRSMQ